MEQPPQSREIGRDLRDGELGVLAMAPPEARMDVAGDVGRIARHPADKLIDCDGEVEILNRFRRRPRVALALRPLAESLGQRGADVRRAGS
jgi:hypothetical protein